MLKLYRCFFFDCMYIFILSSNYEAPVFVPFSISDGSYCFIACKQIQWTNKFTMVFIAYLPTIQLATPLLSATHSELFLILCLVYILRFLGSEVEDNALG